jgi:hypothetical protein
MNADQVQALVQAVESRPQPSVTLMPGTIAAMGTGVAGVVMDGDPDGTSLDASLLFADVGEGDRVMVLFDPPQGVYVVGTIGRAHEAGTVILRGDTAPGLQLDDETVTVPVSNVEFHFGRQYRFTTRLNASWVSGGTGPEEVVSLSSIAQYFPGFGSSNFSFGAAGYVHGESTQGAYLSVYNDQLFVPVATFVTDWAWDVSCGGGVADVSSSMEITDVGPAPPQS